MSRRTAKAFAPRETGLYIDAGLASRGDEAALDRLFAELGNSVWGIAYSSAYSVCGASKAVAEGFVNTLQFLRRGFQTDDVHREILRAAHRAALSVNAEQSEPESGKEPLSLLGETKDRQATLAYTALSEPLRTALWVVEAEGLSVSQAAELLEQPPQRLEEIVREARSAFRRYYVNAIRRDALSPECSTALDNLAGYAGRHLSAGDMSSMERHLNSCDDCRSIAIRLGDLEGRLRGAIPPLPAWTRQTVADEWGTRAPRVEVEPVGRPHEKRHNAVAPALAAFLGLVAFAGILVVGGWLGSGSPEAGSKLAGVTSAAGSFTPGINNNDTTSTQDQPAPTTNTTLAPDDPGVTVVSQPPTTTRRGGTVTTVRQTTLPPVVTLPPPPPVTRPQPPTTSTTVEPTTTTTAPTTTTTITPPPEP